MKDEAERRSPVHAFLEARGARWGRVSGALIALRVGPPEEEAQAVRELGLCDLSALPKLGIKGPGAEGWLAAQEIELPGATYDTRRLRDGGLIVRLGPGDFLLEGGPSDGVLPNLSAELARAPAAVYRVERQDSTFLLAGARAQGVLAQLCSIDFCAAPTGRLILTRAAGSNCGVLREEVAWGTGFRFWVDPTYAVYFWHTLAEIAGELGGKVVGAGVFYPELLAAQGE